MTTAIGTNPEESSGSFLDWPRQHLSDGEDRNLSETEQQGSLLAGALLLGYGLIRRSFPLAAVGGYLAYRGKTGHCRLYESLGIDSAKGPMGLLTTFSRSATINRPPEEIFRFFRDLQDGQRSIRHLQRSGTSDNGGVRWYFRTFEGLPLRWEVEKSEERENELLAWTSAPGARLAMRYVVELEPAPADRGTVVRMRMSYIPPGGGPGAAAGKALGFAISRGIDDDLRRLKQLLETGEIATTEGQPSGSSKRRRLTDPMWRQTS